MRLIHSSSARRVEGPRRRARRLAAAARVGAVCAALALGALGVAACGGPTGGDPDGPTGGASDGAAGGASAAAGDGLPPLVCGTASPPAMPATPLPGGPPIVIIDRAGEDWIVSTAVRKYGFEAERFDYGLGLGVIRPVTDPGVARPGDGPYPAPGDQMLVVGVTVRGESRAYPVRPMTAHEVVNDTVAGVHLAATW